MPKQTSPDYSPRWISRSFHFILALPIPVWVICATIAVASAVVYHLVAWQQGTLARGQFSVFLSSVGVLFILYPIAWHTFARRGQRAIRDFYSQQLVGKNQVEKTAREFISLPDLAAIVAIFIGVATSYFSYLELKRILPLVGQVLPAVSYFVSAWAYAFVALLSFRLLRQIVMMRRLLNETDADIFNPGPVFTLADHSAASALQVFLLTYPQSLILWPQFLFTPVGYFLQGLSLFLSLTLFFAPLAQIGNRRRRSKQKVLYQLTDDLKQLHQELHTALRKGNRQGVERLRAALGALKDEMELVQKISTWPWQPDTLRNLLAPLLIPVIVYLVQRFFGTLFDL